MALIHLKYYKPLSPGQRWRKDAADIKTKFKIFKKFTTSYSWKAGRTKAGNVVFRKQKKKLYKKKTAMTAVLLNVKDIILSQAASFSYFNFKPLVFFVTRNEHTFYLPQTTTNAPGKLFYANYKYKLPYELRFSGLPILLHLIPYYLPFCNIATPPYVKYKYATSSGVYSIKLRAPKKEKLLKIRLPSKSFKLVSTNTLAITGKNKQLWLNKVVLGKAGINSKKGKKQTVRGIAMNSVDHPHGGKANSVQPETSPWGWIAKHSH